VAGPSDAHRAISEGLAALQARDPARAAALLRDAAASAGEDFPWIGGILLLWVCWKMWRELRDGHAEEEGAENVTGMDLNADGTVGSPTTRKTFGQAAWQIIVADVSMSLDNVLAVAGAAREHPAVLVVGLALSIALMGLAASFIARLLQKHRWIAYVGLAIILYVALDMIYRGILEVYPALT